MSYTVRIKMLEESQRLIDDQILHVEKSTVVDNEKLKELQEKKYQYLNEIRRLTRLQWEEDHERVHFDDDR